MLAQVEHTETRLLWSASMSDKTLRVWQHTNKIDNDGEGCPLGCYFMCGSSCGLAHSVTQRIESFVGCGTLKCRMLFTVPLVPYRCGMQRTVVPPPRVAHLTPIWMFPAVRIRCHESE